MEKQIKKILILRLSSIGDILLSTPLLRVLRNRFTAAKIDFVVKSQFVDLLSTNTHLDHLYALDTQKGRSGLQQLRKDLRENDYDLVVDIHNNFRSNYLRRFKNARIVTLRKYRLRRLLLVAFGLNVYRTIRPVHQRYIDAVAEFGVSDDGLGLEFFPDADIQIQIDEKLRNYGRQSGQLTICIAPGASKTTKRWPVDRFAAVCKQLVSQLDAQILLLGDAQDAELTAIIVKTLKGKAIDLAGKLNLMESACALNRADIALTNDSGLMHLATALGKPTVALFGSTVRELGFFPVGSDNIVVENNEISCRPCTHIGRKSCPKKHFKCMRDIQTRQVYQAVIDALQKSLP